MGVKNNLQLVGNSRHTGNCYGPSWLGSSRPISCRPNEPWFNLQWVNESECWHRNINMYIIYIYCGIYIYILCNKYILYIYIYLYMYELALSSYFTSPQFPNNVQIKCIQMCVCFQFFLVKVPAFSFGHLRGTSSSSEWLLAVVLGDLCTQHIQQLMGYFYGCLTIFCVFDQVKSINPRIHHHDLIAIQWNYILIYIYMYIYI